VNAHDGGSADGSDKSAAMTGAVKTSAAVTAKPASDREGSRRDPGPGTGDGVGDQSQRQPGLTQPPQRRDRPSSGFHDTIRAAAEVKKQVQEVTAATFQDTRDRDHVRLCRNR
jgi:hypothetical protein